ncbi:MAG: hypothetical protein NTW74_13680 [Acidobacteria bacterium]|nr:hypothetical protein [Acidobacteriota bacterium]
MIATVLGLNAQTRIVRLSKLDRADAEINLTQLGADIYSFDLAPTADGGLLLGYKYAFAEGSLDGRIGKLSWGDFRFAFSRSDKWYGTSQAPRVVAIGTSILAARTVDGTLNLALWQAGPPDPMELFELNNFLSFRAFSLAPEATVWLQWPGVDTFDQYDVGFNTGRQLPTEVFGASVLFDGEPGLLSYVNRGMIRVTAPRSLAGKSQVSVRMRKAGVLGPETLVRVSPAEIGVGPWVLNEAGRQEILKPGEYMSVYVTGLGVNRESGLSLYVNYQPVTDLEVIDLPGYIPGFKLVMGRVPAAAASPQGARQTINLVWRDPEGAQYSSNLVYSGS